MRLFTCVDIPENIRKELEKVQDKLKDFVEGSFTPVENIHATLKFMGEVNEDILPTIKKVCSNMMLSKKFKLSLHRLGAFPNEKFPRVLWVGIKDGSSELKSLRETLDSKLDLLGFKDETEFSPHLTLVRVKKVKNIEALKKFLENNKIKEFGRFDAKEVILMQSKLTRSGSQYSALGKYELR